MDWQTKIWLVHYVYSVENMRLFWLTHLFSVHASIKPLLSVSIIYMLSVLVLHCFWLLLFKFACLSNEEHKFFSCNPILNYFNFKQCVWLLLGWLIGCCLTSSDIYIFYSYSGRKQVLTIYKNKYPEVREEWNNRNNGFWLISTGKVWRVGLARSH